MAITNWPVEDRPREKLLLQGAKHLTDAELIAIFLQTGTRGKTALDLARELLSEFGGLKKLLAAHPTLLFQKPGMGKAKYAALRAAVELGQRYQDDALQPGELLRSSVTAKRFLVSRLGHYPHEVFACLFLDAQQRVLGFEELFRGTLRETSVYPREVVKQGLAHNAAKIILAHNHPSGNPTPSQADCDVTDILKKALELVDIKLIDHIVVSWQRSVSLADLGLL